MVLVDLRWLSIFLDGANDLRWVRIILDPVTLFPGAYIGFSLCWGVKVAPCFGIFLSLHLMSYPHKFCLIYKYSKTQLNQVFSVRY